MNKDIYLDYASNGKLNPIAFKAMKPYLKNFVGNTASTHPFGVKANIAMNQARQSIANIFGFNTNEVIFTSGATESNNWIIKSVALYELFHSKFPKLHMVVSSIEHSSVLNACKEVEKWGITITYVKPDTNGRIRLAKVREALTKDTSLVCVMSVNNETGMYNHVNIIGKIAHQYGAMMMSDCTQFVGGYLGTSTAEKLKTTFSYVDFITFSGHKIGGPTGIGCLLGRKRYLNFILPLLSGGSQEFSKRGGTSNLVGIVGLSVAIEEAYQNKTRETYKYLYNYLLQSLEKNNIEYHINGGNLFHNIINIDFSKSINSSNLAADLACYGIAVSAGSACDAEHDETKGDFNPSHVLVEMGLNEQQIRNSIRISFEADSTKKSDIDALIKALLIIIKEQRREN